MSVGIIIPARYDSTRFPGKPLVEIKGIPMIQRVVNACVETVGFDNVYVATDSTKIASAVNCNSIMTGVNETGSDRCAEVAKNLDYDIIINVQGDEPLVKSEHIHEIIDLKRKFVDYVINACTYQLNDIENKNTPKVVRLGNGDMIYVSRSPIPYKQVRYLKQVGIYAFYKKQLIDIYDNNLGHLEALEGIEILRCLERDQKVKMPLLDCKYQAVDVPEDVEKVESLL